MLYFLYHINVWVTGYCHFEELSQIAAGVPRRQPHRRSGLATLPSVGAIP